jgi:hypothetical protein
MKLKIVQKNPSDSIPKNIRLQTILNANMTTPIKIDWKA